MKKFKPWKSCQCSECKNERSIYNDYFYITIHDSLKWYDSLPINKIVCKIKK